MELVVTPVERFEIKFEAKVKQPSDDTFRTVSVIAKVYKLETKQINDTLTQSHSKIRLVTNSIVDVLKELSINSDLSNTSYLGAFIKDKAINKEEIIEFDTNGHESSFEQWDDLIAYVLKDFN